MPTPNLPSSSSVLPPIARRLRHWALGVGCVLSLCVFVSFSLQAHKAHLLAQATASESAAPILVETVAAKQAPDHTGLTLPGQTAAWYESTIYSRVDGYVSQWNADIGDHVKKGQVLATLETPDLDAQLVAAQAKLKAAQATVTARRADAAFAKTTYERWKNSPKGVVSEQERDAKRAGYDSAEAQLNEAIAQANLDQADVDRYTSLTQFKQVTAPFDGIITERHIDIGNLVTAGSSPNMAPLYRMEQEDPVRIFSDVPQGAAKDIQAGIDVIVTTSTGQNLTGKVTRTADAIDPKARTLRVETDLPNQDHSLVPGMYVNVSFQVPTEGLIEIPAAALVFRANGPQICVIGKDGRATFHSASIVRDNGSILEISSGASVGDKVALNISSRVSEGDRVRLSDEQL